VKKKQRKKETGSIWGVVLRSLLLPELLKPKPKKKRPVAITTHDTNKHTQKTRKNQKKRVGTATTTTVAAAAADKNNKFGFL
jgi:hypothetical protein